MRIGFFGNTNNYPFMLAVALRRRGHEVLFIVDQTDPLYRPECRYPQAKPGVCDWIADLSPIRFRDYVLPSRKTAHAVRLLRRCDVVVLNQYGPSLLPAIGRPGLALLTGSDLEIYASPSAVGSLWRAETHKLNLKEAAALLLLRRLVHKQRQGIRQCGVIRFFPKGIAPRGDRLLEELSVTERVKLFIPMTDIHDVSPAPLPRNDPPRLVGAARLNWKKPMRPGATELDYKGNDIMIRGVARFMRETGRRVELHLVRKGWDVAATERLVAEEGLGDQVVWHDEMTQSQLFALMRSSEVVIEQLDRSLPGSGAVDALALGRPVIANWRRDMIPEYRRLPEVALCQAANEAEVRAQLGRLLLDRSELERVSQEGRRAVVKHLSSDVAAQECETHLAALAAGSPRQ